MTNEFSHFLKQRGRSPDGFTLLEVVVALAVLAVVIVSALRLQTQNVRMTEAVAFRVTAPLLAASRLGDLAAEGYASPLHDHGDFGDDRPGYGWQLSVEETGADPLAGVGRRLKKIALRIDYNDGEYVYQLQTRRLAPR